MGDFAGHPFRGNQHKKLGDLQPGDKVVSGPYGDMKGTVARVQSARAPGYKVVEFEEKDERGYPRRTSGHKSLDVQIQAPDLEHLARENKIPANIGTTAKVDQPSRATLEKIGGGGIKGYSSMTPKEKDAAIDAEIKRDQAREARAAARGAARRAQSLAADLPEKKRRRRGVGGPNVGAGYAPGTPEYEKWLGNLRRSGRRGR